MELIQVKTYQIWNAGHDRNGNPRKALVQFIDGSPVASVDVGYMGTIGALEAIGAASNAVNVPEVYVRVSEYKRALSAWSLSAA